MMRLYRTLIYKLWRLIDNAAWAINRHGQRIGAIRKW